MSDAADIAKALGGRKSGAGYLARCPAHEDRTPSLSLNEGDDGKLLWTCHAGCSQEAVRDALSQRGLLNVRDPHEFEIRGLGAPSRVWPYHDVDGQLLCKIARYDSAQGKQFRPWRLDGGTWVCKALPVPRPLYGLELLAQHRDAPVLVVEGERCADAARELIGNRYVVVTWPGGAKAVGKADLRPLRARAVTVWPDADKPGKDAAAAIVARLKGIAASVAVLDVDDRADGWDVADAVNDGWAADDLLTFIDERAKRPQSAHADGRPATESHEWPGALDLEVLAKREPELPRFIIADWLPIGYATLLAGHGGVGKSAIALFLAVCIAAGARFFGLEVARRRVFYLSCEDRESVLHWRLSRICSYLRVDLASLRGWLEIIDLVGADAILWDRDPRTGNTLTSGYARLEQRMGEHQSEVLIVDGISDTFAGNENARAEVKRFVNSLVALIPPDTGAVLLVGHVAKLGATAGADGQGYSGSTGWHNSVRARWYLYPETTQGEESERTERTGDLILELQKSNMGRTEQSIRFAWDEDAHLFLARETMGTTEFDRRHRDRIEQQGILAALKACATSVPPIIVPATMQGPRTGFHVLSQRPEFADSMRSGKPAKRRFWRQIETLRQMHAIEECSYRRANRHFGAQLALTTEGMRQCAA